MWLEALVNLESVRQRLFHNCLAHRMICSPFGWARLVNQNKCAGPAHLRAEPERKGRGLVRWLVEVG